MTSNLGATGILACRRGGAYVAICGCPRVPFIPGPDTQIGIVSDGSRAAAYVGRPRWIRRGYESEPQQNPGGISLCLCRDREAYLDPDRHNLTAPYRLSTEPSPCVHDLTPLVERVPAAIGKLSLIAGGMG